MKNLCVASTSSINIRAPLARFLTPDMYDLYHAILSNRYPKMVIQLDTREEWEALDYARLEQWIRFQLTSDDAEMVKAGLANVVFWGNYQSGYVYHRMDRFLNSVTTEQLKAFMKLIRDGHYTLRGIKDCLLPEFSNMSFVSKLLMFLEPSRFVTLDLQLAKLVELPGPNVLSHLTVYTTAIPITDHNSAVYTLWCDHCRDWAAKFPPCLGMRAADVERGIFSLVQAAQIGSALAFL